MPWYPRVQRAINSLLLGSVLLPTQATNLALVVSALLAKRTLCLSELARSYPRTAPEARRVPCPKHDLLHRLKRLSRFLGNPRVDALAVQLALVPTTVAALGQPRILGLAIDWTYFDTTLPTGDRIRYQVLRVAVPRRGRALPLVQLAYDRDDLPAGRSQNQLEEDTLLAVIRALPLGVRPVILADRGFARDLPAVAASPPPRLWRTHRQGYLRHGARRAALEPTFRTPIRPFSQLWASRVIPGSITICSNRGKIFVSRPTLGTWGTMMAIPGDSVENRSPM